MTDLHASPKLPGAAKPRRNAARDATFLRADVHRAEGGALEGLRVRNLSAGGLMVETPQEFAVGDVVTLNLRNLDPVAGRVAWTRPGQVGIAFDRPIKPEVVRKAPPKSPGATMALFKPSATQSRRPALKVG